MSEMNSQGKDGLLEEAAAWFARMRGPDAHESRAEFEKWLARGALHRRAYNRAAEVFAMGKLLADGEPSEGLATEQARQRKPRLVLAAFAAALVLALAGFLALRAILPGSRASGPLVAADQGRVAPASQLATTSNPQSIRLSDNSLIRLASGTTLGVQFGAERRLVLEQGSARFYVAHEPRPFIVAAGGGYVIAHGTIFDVALVKNRRVAVGLIEGAVEVRMPAAGGSVAKAPARHLRAGESMSFAAARASVFAAPPAQSALTAANSGAAGPSEAVDFNSISLGELVHLANAGSSRPIRIADEATARLRVSGMFRMDDTNLLSQRLAALFHLRVDTSNPAEIVLAPR